MVKNMREEEEEEGFKYLFTVVYEEGFAAEMEIEVLLRREGTVGGRLGNDGVVLGGQEAVPNVVGFCGGSESG